MKWVYVGVLVFIALIILLCNALGKKREMTSATGKSVRHLLTSAAVAILAHAFAVIIPCKHGSALGYGVYNVCIDMMIIFLMAYVQHYTGLFEQKKFATIWCGAAVGIDAVLMLINAFVPIVYTTEQTSDTHGHMFYHVADRTPLYYYHLIFVYVMVAFVLLTLTIKTVKTPKIYRIKYLTVLVTLICVIVIHVIYLFLKLTFDYSLLIYAIIAVAVFYFTLYYVPTGLIESLLAFAVTNMRDGIACIDIEGRCVYSNKLIRELFHSDEEINSFYRNFASEDNKDLSSEINWEETRTIAGSTLYFSNNYKPLYDSKNSYIGCFFIFHDNTDEVHKLETERYRATHDKLTGVYNREHFYEKAAEKIRSNPDRLYQIVCTDVKDFKLINDIFGVEAGDEILKKIADKIASLTSEQSVYGRLSGDRFAICMPQERYNPQVFLDAAEQISYLSESSVFRVHVQVGVYAVAPDEDTRAEIMCDRAYLAIKTIKNSYQEIIAYYDDKLRESFIGEQALINEFDDALESGQFKMYLQPQTAVTGEVLGGEALVRWLHPERGLVPPGAFIELFERTGLISRLDAYIWECACKQLKQWKDQGNENYHISVNISPKDLYFTDVYETITGLVEKYGIEPKHLRLEITETAIMTNLETELSLIQRLRNKGFAVEIDDFGSGYSSLNTLKDMQVDTIKIDMGFLRKTTHQERSRCILKTIIELSKELGMEVITEGVETKEQVDFLTEFGCDIFQGYYFAKPMPVEDFENKYFEKEAVKTPAAAG